MPVTRHLRPATVATVAVSAAATWAVVTQVVGVRLGVRFPHSPPTAVALGTTVAAATTASLIGWGFLAALEATTWPARKIWATVATAVFLASLALPAAWATTTAAAVGLAIIHLVVASVTVIGFTRVAGRRPTSPGAGQESPGCAATGPMPHHLHGRSQPVLVVLVALAVLGGTVAAFAGTSSAGAAPGAATGWATSVPAPAGAAPWSSRPSEGAGLGRWMSPAAGARTEDFHVVSTDATGPGAIIITGVVNAGGIEHPGRAIDGASFAGGGFRIDHSGGHPTVVFDPKTCVGTIDQVGAFSVIDGTGRFSTFDGRGRYVFHVIYTTSRASGGCTRVMTAYLETIDGAVTLSPSVARSLAAPATP